MRETEAKETDETELNDKFEYFWREYGQIIYNLALRMLGDPSEAEDVTQETFLRAWAALKMGREIVSPGSWLARVAANATLDELRRRRRKKFCEYPREQEFPSVSLAGPEAAVVEQELKEEIWQALGRLKPVYGWFWPRKPPPV
jgi:RNA polymerase sigma-70 factor (ECF subfamily)